jgi:hypothetical protein
VARKSGNRSKHHIPQTISEIAIPLWNLSADPVQKYPIFLGWISLGVKGGLSSGGVGTCKIGNGGALVVRGSVTPGIDGIRGGKDRHSTAAKKGAIAAKEYFILMRRFEGDRGGLLSKYAGIFQHLYI